MPEPARPNHPSVVSFLQSTPQCFPRPMSSPMLTHLAVHPALSCKSYSSTYQPILSTSGPSQHDFYRPNILILNFHPATPVVQRHDCYLTILLDRYQPFVVTQQFPARLPWLSYSVPKISGTAWICSCCTPGALLRVFYQFTTNLLKAMILCSFDYSLLFSMQLSNHQFFDPIFDMSTFYSPSIFSMQVRTTTTMFPVFSSSFKPTTNQVTGHSSLDQIAFKCDLGRPRGS